MGFLQTPPHDGRPCPLLTVPTAMPVVDFHHLVVSHAERTDKNGTVFPCRFFGLLHMPIFYLHIFREKYMQITGNFFAYLCIKGVN